MTRFEDSWLAALNRAFSTWQSAFDSVTVDTRDRTGLDASRVGSQWWWGGGRAYAATCKWRGGVQGDIWGPETMHLLLNRHDLLATTGAFSLCHFWLQHCHEEHVVLICQYIQEFLCKPGQQSCCSDFHTRDILTNDIVAIVVSDESDEHAFTLTSVAMYDNAEHLFPPGLRRMSQALLNDIAGELVLAVSFQSFDDQV